MMQAQPEPGPNSLPVRDLTLTGRLSERHLRMLREESAISDAVIAARGYRSILDGAELREFGFAPAQYRPGLLLPVCGPDGSNGLYVLRPDAPRSLDEKEKAKLPDGTYPQRVLKYELPKGATVRIDCSPVCRPGLADPKVPLWITEGQKKGDALASAGLCALALLGVWNFKGKNAFGASTVLADLDHVAWKDRDVRIVYDSDVMTKKPVQDALRRLTAILQNRGAQVAVVYLPNGPNGHKLGVDDFLAAGHTLADLEALVEAPRPEPVATPAAVELLDTKPATMRRPLALIESRAYAATWLHARVTRREGVDRRGELVRYDPPKVSTELRQFIIRDDGQIFGDTAAADVGAVADLPFDIILPEVPPLDRVWSVAGIKRFAQGGRPDPAEVFGRVGAVVDRFLDFNRSLADQKTMAELIACYIVATYLLDAFTVVGFLWPNGDRGSGKTILLTVVCELAYLGQVILSGGSFASLRDLADYGATLAFDDAEGLADPRKTDPDKRALLLAGNRRGNTVPVKEPTSERAWRTRYVNTFCPRLFSATKLPDPILASRSIVIPLIRTPDRYRANADPLDYPLWPHDRQTLVDDLWALGLAHLPELAAYETKVNDRAALTGRNLEPWRAILAVALWLDDCGVSGLFARLDALSVAYQSERIELEYGDLTALVIRALCRYAEDHVDAVSTKADAVSFPVGTSDLTAQVKEFIEADELDIDQDAVSARRVGRVLAKMRLKSDGNRLKPDRTAKKKGWSVTLGDVRRWSAAYAVPFASKNDVAPDVNGTNGTSGITAQNAVCEADREVFDL